MNLKFETVRGCARPPTGTFSGGDGLRFWRPLDTYLIAYENEPILTALNVRATGA